jgi:hypothetical protein
MRLFPLFLGDPLLGSCPTCPSRRGRSSGLGDAARLGLAQDLGLLNDSRSLECLLVNCRSRGARGTQEIHTETGVLRALPELALGLAAALVAVFLVVALVVVFLLPAVLAAFLGAAFLVVALVAFNDN